MAGHSLKGVVLEDKGVLIYKSEKCPSTVSFEALCEEGSSQSERSRAIKYLIYKRKD